MKNELALCSLIASLIIAINTAWCVPAKVFVIASALAVAVLAVKGVMDDEN